MRTRSASMARASIGAVVLGLLLALCCAATVVHGKKEWIVGDDKGWSFGIAGWEKGKPIEAGDVLVFKYDAKSHNVVEVDEGAYYSCKPGGVARTYTSGDDHIKLGGAKAFFICSLPDHCEQGMKIAVTTK